MRILVVFLAALWYASATHNGEVHDCSFRRRGVVEGHITIGFMFQFFGPLDDSPVCGGDIPSPDNIQLIEAAIYAVKNAQRRFPNLTIGLEAYDSCYSSTAAVDRAVAFLGDRQVNDTCGVKIKPGFIGSLEGDRGSVVAQMMYNARVGVTSFSASLPEVTSITRMVPAHDEEARVITRFLEQARWTYVNLVIAGDQRGSLITNFLRAAAESGICISQRFPLNGSSISDNDIADVFGSLLRSRDESNINTIVVIGNDDGVVDSFLSRAPPQASTLHFVVGHGRFLEDMRYGSARNLNISSAVPEALHVPGGDSGFDDYFQGLNLTDYDHEADPWFRDYWRYRYSCDANCSTEEHVESYRRHPLVTSVIDAIDAHIEAFAATYVGGAAGSEGYAEALNEVMFDSRIGTGRTVAFQPNGDPEGNRFTIWMRQLDTVNRISESVDGALSPLSDEFTAPPSECVETCLDPQCHVPPPEEVNAYVGGDVVLAGFFPVNEWDEELSRCGNYSENGALYVEAMLYAIDRINEDDTILPGIRLGFDGYNTCANPQRATDTAIDLLNAGSFDLSHSATRLSADGRRLEHFFGVVGPASLEAIKGVNNIVSTKMVPMVGYAVDDPTISSFSYPYLARTLSSSVVHIHPTLRWLSEQRITLFQVAYTDGLPGLRTARSYLGSGSWTGVCRTQEVQIPTSDDAEEWDAFFVTLKKTPDAKALYLLATAEDARRVLLNMERREDRYLIIAGPSWTPTEEDIRNYPSAKGAIFISRPKRKYDGFKEYLTRVDPKGPRYTDATGSANPWLADFLQSKGVANLGDAHIVEDEAIPRIIDATYALAQTMNIQQLINCPVTRRVCPALLAVDGQNFLTTLRDRTEFDSPNDQRPISFDYSYSLDYSFDVLNIQEEGIVKIGTMETFSVRPSSDGASLKFYDAGGSEITDPEEQAIACTTTSCLKSCERPDTDLVAESQYDGSGDVWIGGFFELSLPSADGFQCSNEMVLENMQLVEAFLFAVDEVNRKFDVLPNLRLSGIGFDSCGSQNRVLKEAGNLVFGTVDYRASYTTQELFLFGIIGGSNSDTTRALSDTVASIGVNQISYAATASEFSDTSRYPHLLRTVPSDANQARAFIDVLTHFGWGYVSVVYSDNLYGNDMLRIFTDSLDRRTICVAMALRVEGGSNEEHFENIIDTLQDNSASRTVVLFTSDVDTRSVLQAAERLGVTDVQWVGSDTWGGKQYVVADATNTSRGAITIRFQNRVVQSFVDYFSALNPYQNFRNPWYKQFFADFNKCDIFGLPMVYGTYCPFPYQIDPEMIDNPLVPRVINAVFAYAYGLHAALRELCPDVPNHHLCPALENQPSKFHEILQNITFPSAEDPQTDFFFDGSGDAAGTYDILNLVPDADTNSYAKIGSWDRGDLSFSSNPTFYRNGKMIGADDVGTECSGRCSECDIKDEFLYASLDGPVQIAGVAGVHGSRRCGNLTDSGVFDAEAFLYAIEYVNGRGDLLPGVQLGGKVFDGCGVRSVRELSSYIDGVGDFANRSSSWQWIVGVVGAATPSTTMLVQHTVEHYQLPQVSYSFTPDGNYESVIKTTQGTDAYIQAIQDTLKRLQWTSVAVIADANDDTQMLLYDTFLQSVSDICVERSQTFTDINSATDVSDRVVVVFASARVINNLAVDTGSGGHKTYIFAGVSDAEAVTPSLANRGSIILSFSRGSPAFEVYLREMDLSATPVNPWLAEYVSRELQCNVGRVTDSNKICSDSDRLSPDKVDIANARRIIDSVLAIAASLGRLRDSRCGSDSRGLCPELLEAGVDGVLTAAMDVDFRDDDGRVVNFRGGRQDLVVSIWNIPSESKAPIKLTDWNVTLPAFINQPMFYDGDNAPTKVEATCATPTPTERTQMPPNRTPIPPGRTPGTTEDPGSNQAQRGDPISEDYHREVWFIIALILSGLGILLTILATVIFFVNRNRNYAQLHASLLIYTLAVSLLVMFAGSFAFGFRVDGYLCVLRRVLPGASFSLAFSCVFLMAGRYFRILKKERRVSGLGAKYIDNRSQLLALLALSLVGATVLLQWIVFEPPEVRETPPKDGSANGTDETKAGPVRHCAHVDGQSPISFVFIFLLMIGTLMLSMSAMRRSMVYFRRELQSMVLGIVLSFVLALAWIICSIAKGPEPDFYIPATCFVGIVQGYILLVTLFPPIIRGLYRLDQDLFFDAETNSVVDGNSGFTNPVSEYESPKNQPTEELPEKAQPAEMQLESPM